MFHRKKKVKKDTLVPTTNSPFAKGQRWSYQTRAGEEGSTFVVLQVEEVVPLKKNVVHVRLEGLKLKSPAAPTGFTDVAGHLPVEEKVLSSSALEKVGEGVPVGKKSLEGYAIWRKEWDREKAGIFTIPLAEVADTLEVMMSQGQPQ